MMPSKKEKIYGDFIKEVQEFNCLGTVTRLLCWDQETCMPSGGMQNRANQIQLLSGLSHERLIHPKITEFLEKLMEKEVWQSLSENEQANVREMKRDHDKAGRLPTSLVKETAHTIAYANEVWAKARQENRFEDFAPWLEKMVRLKQNQADCFDCQEKYDPLLDDSEPHMTTAELKPLFERLKKSLIPLIEKFSAEWGNDTTKFSDGAFPIAGQKELGLFLLQKIGFDMESGRIDDAVHPFCLPMPGDTRLTTRYKENDLRPSFFGVLHEGGHGLYEQGFLKEYENTPMAQATSLGIHESQSRFWENFIGRSRAFWEFCTPVCKKQFPKTLAGMDEEKLFRWVNQVRPGFIRVESDEVTYNLHIILRFELEHGLLHGDIAVADLPTIWNQKMKEYFGITPPDNRQGVLQDIHWSNGDFGYFPTYTLGNLYAAQWHHQAKKEIPTFEDQVARGEFGEILNWLRQKIHVKGRCLPATRLCEVVTGEKPNEKYFLDYLNTKFST